MLVDGKTLIIVATVVRNSPQKVKIKMLYQEELISYQQYVYVFFIEPFYSWAYGHIRRCLIPCSARYAFKQRNSLVLYL